MTKRINKSGISENWVKKESTLAKRSDAKQKFKKVKQQEIGKQYIRIPHPTLKNTYILKERVQESN